MPTIPEWTPSDLDLSWLAGLLEGEGAFTLNRGRFPVVAVAMTDRDVIEKAARIMRATTVYTEGPKKSGWKTVYRAQVVAYQAVRIMTEIRPLMGTRRAEQISTALDVWDSMPHYREKNQPNTCGHDFEPHYGRGLCKPCYFKWYDNRNKRAATTTVIDSPPEGLDL